MTTPGADLQTLVGGLITFDANDGTGVQTGTVISVDLDGRVVISVSGLNRTYLTNSLTFYRAL